jgi:predicted SprT family Zn-dependent metalloprotease
MRNELENTINECLEKFVLAFPRVIIPQIIWNPKMRSTAGKVRVNRNLKRVEWIQLNPHLLNDCIKLERTLLHELAHVADFYVYNTVGHGRTWRHCMIKLGQEPSRCHNYDTSGLKRKHKRVAMIQCQCRTMEITSQRLKKIQSGRTYTCLKCRQQLVLMPQNEAA